MGPHATPTSPKHRPKISLRAVLDRIEDGAYVIDPVTAEVRTRRGRVIRGFLSGKKNGPKYRFVRIHARHPDGRLGVKTIMVARLVWISVTRCEIPKCWQIHHRDRNSENDAWANLLCLHELDHKKVHAGDATPAEEEIPF